MDVQQIVGSIDHVTLRDKAYKQWNEKAKLYSTADLFNDLIIAASVIAVVAVVMMASAHIIEAFKRNTTEAAANAAPWLTETLLIIALWRRAKVNWLGVVMTVLVVLMSFLSNLFVGLTAAKGDDQYELLALVAAAAIPFGTMYLGHRIPELLLARNFVLRKRRQWIEDAPNVLRETYMQAYMTAGIPLGRAAQIAEAAANRFKPLPVTVTVTAEQPEYKALPTPLSTPRLAPPVPARRSQPLPDTPVLNDSQGHDVTNGVTTPVTDVTSVTNVTPTALQRICGYSKCQNPIHDGQLYCCDNHRVYGNREKKKAQQ